MRTGCAALVALVAIVAGLSTACTTTTGRLVRDSIVPVSHDDVERTAYVESLVAQAHALRLSHATMWRRLGHWQRTKLGFLESQADGPDFFMSAHGVDDPDAELDATIRAFFATMPADAGTLQHPICHYPARFRWLDSQLHFDQAKLPTPKCTRYEEFLAQTDAASLSFVFSSYYLNNPASVFGHTFVRIVRRDHADAAGAAAQEHHDLLDRTVEFSATVDTKNALVYGVKGIAGMFPGTFRNVPYYFKVRQYNDFESRDLYEYELSFTPDEVSMFLAHLWELGSTFFDYYYVSENCSYHLLGALEVARPSLQLLSHMHWPVVPADTIKALYANPGFVKAMTFRPSLRRTFQARVAGLTAAEQATVEELVTRPDTALAASTPRPRAAKMFDAAQDLVDILHAKEITYDLNSPAAQRKQRLLERRAELAVISPPVEVAIPTRSEPQLGHGSHRMGVGLSADTDGAQSYVLDARLVLHDLADPTPGYPELSQLEFLPLRARVRIDNAGKGDRFLLDNLSLVRILSLTPQDRFDRKLSWKVDLGLTRITDGGCIATGCVVGQLRIGTGAALASTSQRATIFLTVDALVQSGPHLQGIETIPLRAGAGPAGGVRFRLADGLVWLTTGELLWLPDQAPTFAWQAKSILRLGLGHALALSAEGVIEGGGPTAAGGAPGTRGGSFDAPRATGQLLGLVYF